ncbi:hypothetical protein [Peribacillus aracenensis]|uniref:hypothetical protein n=1 Tax=Peribacillus aracenensis TaxID=2976708 RepID=UPI0021A4B291|nr:hypothetical protein [Peribacillus sp. BBB004]
MIPIIPFPEISDATNKINHLISQGIFQLDIEEQQIMLSKLVEKMKERIDEADATDCSRLCWLLLKLDYYEEASKYLELGLSKEPDNDHLNKLKTRIVI